MSNSDIVDLSSDDEQQLTTIAQIETTNNVSINNKNSSPVKTPSRSVMKKEPDSKNSKTGPKGKGVQVKSKKLTDFFKPKDGHIFYKAAEVDVKPKTKPRPKSNSTKSSSRSSSKSRSRKFSSESASADSAFTENGKYANDTDDGSSVISDKSSISARSGNKSESSKSSVPRKSRKNHRAPEPPLPENVPADTEIVEIIDIWWGPSDKGVETKFVLPKYKGFRKPAWESDAWLHVSEVKGEFAEELVEECRLRKKKKEEEKERRKQPKWVYVDDEEDDKVPEMDKIVKEAQSMALAGGDVKLQTRHKEVYYGDDPSVDTQKPRKTRVRPTEPEVPEPPRGFERGLEPEYIVGAHVYNGQLLYLMKWVDSDEPEFVLQDECNIKCPSLVIGFLEDGLVKTFEDRKLIV